MNVDINIFFFYFSLHLPNYKVWGKEIHPVYFYNDFNLFLFFILGWNGIKFALVINVIMPFWRIKFHFNNTPSIYYNPSSISCFYLFSECSLQGRNPQWNMLYRVCYQIDLGLYGVIWWLIVIWNSFDLHLLFENLGQNARTQEARKMARAPMDLGSVASVSINRS